SRGHARHVLLCRGPARALAERGASVDVADLRRISQGDRHRARHEPHAPRRPQSPAAVGHGQGRVGSRGHGGRDRRHAATAARGGGRPGFFLTFDAAPRPRVEAATREGAQLYALLRAIPFNPRFTLKKTTFFSNLDVWDVAMAKPLEERLAAFHDPGKRAELREWADKRQRRRPGVPGRFIKWQSIVVKKTALAQHRGLEGHSMTDLAAEQGKHVADVMLDLALAEQLETEFQLQSRPPAEDVDLAEFVKAGHAIPSQSDAAARVNTIF